MKYSLIEGNLAELKTPCLVTTLKSARTVARAIGKSAALNRATTDFGNKLEQTLVVQLDGNISRLVIVGGAEAALSPDQFRKLAHSAANALVKLPTKQAVVALDAVRVSGKKSAFKQLALMRAISSAAYHYGVHKSNSPKPPQLANVRLTVLDKKATGSIAKLAKLGIQAIAELGDWIYRQARQRPRCWYEVCPRSRQRAAKRL